MFPETPLERSPRSPPEGGPSLCDGYARYAEQCQRMAGGCKSEGEKSAWLRVAAAWLQLANDINARETKQGAQRCAADGLDTESDGG
jgi:hypothetical protein